MKQFLNNFVITFIALIILIMVHHQLNFLRFSHLGFDYLEKIDSFTLSSIAIFLYYSIPALLIGLAMAKLLKGLFKIYWCLALSLVIFIWFQPVHIIEIDDVSFVGVAIMYISQYSHPIFVVIPSLITLKWPNQSFKWDALKRALYVKR